MFMLSNTPKSEQGEFAAYEIFMLQTKAGRKKIVKTTIRNAVSGLFP